MKRLLILAIVILFIAGCGGSDSDVERQGSDVKSDGPSAKEKLVNFKCVIGDVQEYYFFEDKMKLKSPAAEGWIIDDIYYVKVDVNGKDYLVTGMMDAEVTTEEMLDMYKTSKMTPNIDCSLGKASKAIVSLPDLPIISNEEMADEMMKGMGGGFTQ